MNSAKRLPLPAHPDLMPPRTDFFSSRLPARALAISMAALAVAVSGSVFVPEALPQYEILIWLTPLVPAFLWSYYLGWQGAAVGLALAMVVLTAGQVLVGLLGRDTLAHSYLITVAGIFVAVVIGVGVVAELLHLEREKAYRLAVTDELTGLINRRGLILFLNKEFAAAQRGRKLTVALFDLDRFKEFNDRHGHAAGDDVLRDWANLLENVSRGMDLSARIGGEEFVTILSESAATGGEIFAGRVRKALDAMRFAGQEVTVSIGIAEYHKGMATPDDLLAAADAAMYRAKAGGRNCIAVADPDAAGHPTLIRTGSAALAPAEHARPGVLATNPPRAS